MRVWGAEVDFLHIESFDRKIRQESRNINRPKRVLRCVSRSQSAMVCIGWKRQLGQRPGRGLASPYTPGSL